MTKDLHLLATRLQRQMLEAAWPPGPATRVYVDAYLTLVRWHWAGEHVYRVRDGRSPAIDPGLALATAPVVREAVVYVLDREDWVAIARHPARHPITVGPGKMLGYPAPVLTYCTEVAGGTLAAGYVNLTDQPTPRHLHMLTGTSLTELGPRPLGNEEIGEEMLRLARVLPYYYAPTR
jgi:hypothetical protein